MKNLYFYSILIAMTASCFSCKKNDDNSVSPSTSNSLQVATKNVTNITGSSAEVNGEVTNTGSIVLIERGVCWNTSTDPTIENNKKTSGSGAGTFSVTLSGLSAGTSYYVRAYATNSAGTTSYGSTTTFTTLEGFEEGIVTDEQGNSYKTLKIGNQTWMVENLRTTKYNNGDNILTTNPANADLSLLSENKFQWPCGGDELNAASYGRLYSYHVLEDSRGICPQGWHIPSSAEWIELSDYFKANGFGENGTGNMYGKSVASTSGWNVNAIPGYIGNNPSANNRSGFNAFPNGTRSTSSFMDKGNFACWWTSTTHGAQNAYDVSLMGLSNYGFATGNNSKAKGSGKAVRCVKD